MLLSHTTEWDSDGVQLLCCHSLLAYGTSENGGGKGRRGEGEFVFGLSLSTIHSFFVLSLASLLILSVVIFFFHPSSCDRKCAMFSRHLLQTTW